MSTRDLSIGSVVAGYRIEGEIGRGGMGIVYRATQLALDRTVAFKVITPELSADADFRERFHRESQLTASIDHPNVIPVYEAGDAEGLRFIAMRLVDGVDLGHAMREEGRLDPGRAARIVMQVAKALDAAHQRGLVHRDVKPGNILLTGHGNEEHAYLTDFGLTRMMASSSLTQTGHFVGTVDYISPEQISGEATDARGDVYALGCVLYEALTGNAPFAKDTEIARLWAHMNEPAPRPSDHVPGLPREFDAVIERALAKSPKDRFPSAGDLGRAALEAASGAPHDSTGDRTMPSDTAVAAAPPPAPVELDAFALPASDQSLPQAAPPPTRAPRGLRRRPETRKGTRRRRRPPEGQSGSSTGDTHPPIRVALNPAFTFLHEPLDEDAALPMLGNEDVVETVVNRVAHSHGGCFLVTGFRGVGKTTVVRRALSRLDARAGDTDIVAITLNVPRPRTTTELLFEIVRRLHEYVRDAGVGERLDPGLAERLDLAYERTSLALTHTQSSAVERSRGLSVGTPGLSGISGRFDASRKLANSRSTEGSYLPYSDADVEHDFERIAALMSQGVARAEATSSHKGLARFLRAKEGVAPWKGRLVVVLDELDKLTDQPEGKQAVRDILMGMKNLLSTSGAHFVFVAGPDLHYEAIEDRRRGNSIFDSVFAEQVYVPAIWNSEGSLLEALIPDAKARRSPQVAALQDHLAFWGRGLPRLLVREFESFVRWYDDRPYLVLDNDAMMRIGFYAGLQRLTREFVRDRVDSGSRTLDDDQWRIGIYHAVEWVLSLGFSFNADEVAEVARDSKIEPLIALEEEELSDLMAYLAERGLLRQVHGGLSDQPYYGDEPMAQLPAYEVSDTVEQTVRELSHVAASEAQAAESVGVVDGAARVGAIGQELAGGRYMLLEELDRTGTGHVYRAHDARLDTDIAVKLFDLPTLRDNERMRARFLREGAIALELNHPHIVRTHDTFGEDDGRLAIAMEFLEGRSLKDELRAKTTLPPDGAARMARGVLDALVYLSEMGIARLDLRPSTIMLDSSLEATIVNLGLAKHIGPDASDGPTQVGAVVGTPAYAAPEQLAGDPVDIRTDLFSLALILFEAISGRPARQAGSIMSVVQAALNEDVDLTQLRVSPTLKTVMARALEHDPVRRFSSPTEMLQGLAGAPEAKSA